MKRNPKSEKNEAKSSIDFWLKNVVILGWFLFLAGFRVSDPVLLF